MKRTSSFLTALALAVAALGAQTAAPTPVLSSGNTAWLLAATALVMFMTAPALGLFYGGLVRKKNVLSVLMQCFAALAIVSVIWVAFGYSLAFSDTEIIPGVLGDFKWAFFSGMTPEVLSPYYISDATGRVPHLVFAMFQCMFAVITPALIAGAFAERMKFSFFVLFTALWEILIYIPLAHMVWSANGFLFKLGVLDFAGGTVVHINAGFAALAVVLLLGRRSNHRTLPPHNLAYTMMGAAMLWFGWFGFNAGSSLAADGIAAGAFVATNSAAAAAGLVWPFLDWLINKRPTMLGAATGAVVGLVAVTPAAGFVNPAGAMAIGAIATIVCFFMVTVVKEKLGYDDALDAFGCHGIGGIVGALLTGVFADPRLWKAFGATYSGTLYGNPAQLGIQAIGVLVSVCLAFFGTLVIYKLVDLVLRARVSVHEEEVGLDITQHNERAYTVID
ncbi:MAG: ammonium transporter [Rectinemataceae bacterium]